MRLLFFTILFIVYVLIPPVLNMGVYKNDAGRWVFDTTYAIIFLIISFLLIHDFIHKYSHSHDHDEDSNKEAS